MHDLVAPVVGDDVGRRRIRVAEEETMNGSEDFLIVGERSFTLAVEAEVGRYFQV